MRSLGWNRCLIDRTNGKIPQHSELQVMLDFIRQGEVVIMESISRFARNIRDLMELGEQLTAKGVEFVSRKEAIDTSTPTGKFRSLAGM